MRNKIATLTAALLEGSFEQPLWNSFLQQLRHICEADYVSLLFKPPGWRKRDSLILSANGSTIEQTLANYRRHSYPDYDGLRLWMTDGRPYPMKAMIEADRGEHQSFFDEMTEIVGITASLFMRVEEKSGVDGWLSLARRDGSFPPNTDSLLREIAPVLRGVLRLYIAREQERFAARLNEETVQKLQFGWIALDAAGLILSADPFGEQVLAAGEVLARDREGRLEVRQGDLQREIGSTLAKLAASPQAAARAIPLRADPWLDMLLVPARYRPLTSSGTPAVIAYVHGDSWSSSLRESRLCEMFALSASEARLALALCRGKRIAEAGEEIGLTVETARSYSKAIYAKTGARGQPDLVRIILGSILALASEG
ncbi:MAG: helix-turn-helix transcriptional regulator [Novosphingobium sp.]